MSTPTFATCLEIVATKPAAFRTNFVQIVHYTYQVEISNPVSCNSAVYSLFSEQNLNYPIDRKLRLIERCALVEGHCSCL